MLTRRVVHTRQHNAKLPRVRGAAVSLSQVVPAAQSVPVSSRSPRAPSVVTRSFRLTCTHSLRTDASSSQEELTFYFEGKLGYGTVSTATS